MKYFTHVIKTIIVRQGLQNYTIDFSPTRTSHYGTYNSFRKTAAEAWDEIQRMSTFMKKTNNFLTGTNRCLTDFKI